MPSTPGCSPPSLTLCPQVHSLQELRRSASLATKVFVQRDYSDGTTCQFQTKFPPELESRIERQLFEETVKTLNGFYAEAEKIGGSSYLEGCLACATAYFIFLCMETHYEKVLKKISKYIQDQNEKIYAPRGLLLTDPLERGMRWVCPCSDPLWAGTGAGASQVLPTEPNFCQGAPIALPVLAAPAERERSLPCYGQSQLAVSLSPRTGTGKASGSA
ncbi:hypothetical protein Nmel_010364 [Mimus melanotis]